LHFIDDIKPAACIRSTGFVMLQYLRRSRAD
jgi:hypothetical protein